MLSLIVSQEYSIHDKKSLLAGLAESMFASEEVAAIDDRAGCCEPTLSVTLCIRIPPLICILKIILSLTQQYIVLELSTLLPIEILSFLKFYCSDFPFLKTLYLSSPISNINKFREKVCLLHFLVQDECIHCAIHALHVSFAYALLGIALHCMYWDA